MIVHDKPVPSDGVEPGREIETHQHGILVVLDDRRFTCCRKDRFFIRIKIARTLAAGRQIPDDPVIPE